MKELNAEEVADTFKIIIPKIEKGEMKYFIINIRNVYYNLLLCAHPSHTNTTY